MTGADASSQLWWWALLCTAAVLGLLVAEWRESRVGRVLCKLLASTAFVALALHAGSLQSSYGQLVLLALILSWIGDALLLSRQRRGFLAGIGAFLFAHLAFAFAFLSLPVARNALLLGAVAMAVVGAAILRWLWPHLHGAYRGAVAAYVAAILAMVATAMGASVALGDLRLALAALAFAASDIAVARNRFVAPGFVNRLWGQPLYYAAQLALAASVAWLPVPG